MNKISRFCLFWLTAILLVSQTQTAHAQGSQYCSNYNGPLVTPFSSWDWTLPPTDSRYCQMWAAQLLTPGVLVIGAPWERAPNGLLFNIRKQEDYTREKGWELLRMDFGAYQRIKVPYFFLYNKYSGIIRAFFWLDSALGTFPNGVTITMSHVFNRQNTGIISLSNKILKSQDFYLGKTTPNTEAITYACELTQSTGWVMADFQTAFDSYSSNQNYSATALQFDVAGVTTTTIKGKGNFNFKTDAKIEEGGYAISSAKPPQTAVQFAADTKKTFSYIASDELSGVLDNFVKKANTTAATVPLPAVQAKTAPLVQAANSQAVNPFENIFKLLGSVNTAFGIFDTIVGALWPSSASAPSKATASNGVLELQGTITTTSPLTSRTVQVPGTQHNSNTNTQPYYDCPLGIFNIENTPLLKKMRYDYADGTYNTRTSGPIYVIKQYDSYQVDNDLRAVYNEAAGLSLESVQASILGKSPTPSFNFVRDYRNQLPDYVSGAPYSDLNFMHQQVMSGEIEVINANSDTVTFATPFTDLKNFKGMAFTVPLDSKVYVRIKAVLRRKDNPASPPIYYVQDYAVQTNSTTVATNPRYAPIPPNGGPVQPMREPPFTSLASLLIGPQWTGVYNASTAQSVTLNDFTSTGATRPYVVWEGTYSNPVLYSAFPAIEAGTGPNFSRSATYPYPYSGIVTIDHPNTAQPSMYLSNVGISLGAGFSVTPGTNFIAATPLLAYRTGGNGVITSYNGYCPRNTAADRLTMLATTEAVNVAEGIGVYPNPTDGKVTITTTLSGSVEGQLTILDYMGREVSTARTVHGGKQQMQLDLSGYQSGLYMVSLKAEGRVFTQKLLIK